MTLKSLHLSNHYVKISIKKLEEECFGNIEDGSGENSTKNAYMLIYERKIKTPLKKPLCENEIDIDKVIEFNSEDRKSVV